MDRALRPAREPPVRLVHLAASEQRHVDAAGKVLVDEHTHAHAMIQRVFQAPRRTELAGINVPISLARVLRISRRDRSEVRRTIDHGRIEAKRISRRHFEAERLGRL